MCRDISVIKVTFVLQYIISSETIIIVHDCARVDNNYSCNTVTVTKDDHTMTMVLFTKCIKRSSRHFSDVNISMWYTIAVAISPHPLESRAGERNTAATTETVHLIAIFIFENVC